MSSIISKNNDLNKIKNYKTEINNINDDTDININKLLNDKNKLINFIKELEEK